VASRTPALASDGDSGYTALRLSALAFAQTASNLGIALDGSVPFSVDAWLKFNGLGASSSILSKAGAFTFGSIGNSVLFQIAGYPGVLSDPRRAPLDDEGWHYLCVTYSQGQTRIYIDGEFNVFQAISGSGTSNANPFLIGADLAALVWNVRVYNTALSASTVMANMFGEPAASSVVAYFDFSQDPPVDRGSGHLPIQLQSGAMMVTSTPAVHLGGTAYAQPLHDDHVNPGGHQVDPYSVQAWVYADLADTPQQAIFVNSDLESETGIALYLDYDSAAKGFRVRSQRGSNVTGQTLSSSAVVQPGGWFNVATTFDGAKLSIYLNGRPDSSGQFGPIPLVRNYGAPLIGAARCHGQPSGSMPLQGYVYSVDVWGRALTAAEVATYMSYVPDVASAGLEALYDFTTSPARNLVDGHPIGLADGAELSAQVSRSLTRLRASGPPAPAPHAELDEETLREIRESIRFDDVLAAHGDELEAAMESDASLFEGDPEAQQRVRDAWRDQLERMRSDPGSVPFHVTSHVIGGEYVVLCHSRGQTHVAYRADAAGIDECTMWQVRLIFVVIAGILDALFGLSSTLSNQAIQYIGRVLARPEIFGLIAVGSSMSAGVIFKIGKALYTYGYLRDLVKMLITVGFWAFLRVVAKLVLILAGVGAADVIASLVATAATFVATYLDKPASCTALPAVDVGSVKFNYDPTASAVDALSIRKNYTKDVAVPEWTKGKTTAEQSPAAYSIAAVTGKTITIQARFVVNSSAPVQAQVRADGGGVLGAIDPFTVSFKNGVSDPEFVTIQLPHHQLATGGVQRQDIQWTWYYQPSGGSWTQICVTNHRIYALLSAPQTPWVQSPVLSTTQLPWTDVLDYACQWAQGKKTAGDAAAAVTQQVNGGIGLVYDNTSGASKYTDTADHFLCTLFVAYLAGTGGMGNVVNCTDCASIVTAFANVLGCNVFASTMLTPGGGFYTNKIIAVGGSNWAYPFPGTPSEGIFSYHEVAWTGAGSYIDGLYDACLKVDSSGNPWDWTNPNLTHTPQLPLAMAFTTQGVSPTLPIATPFTDSSYRERLSRNSSVGIGRCVPRGAWAGTAGGRRPMI
jgi:hypothetical protein